MRKKWLVVVALSVFVLFAFSSCSNDSSSEENGNAASFSNFKSTNLQGEAVDGSIVKKADLTVINIWGTFCSPCLEEMPGLGKLAKDYEGKGVQIIGIPVDVTSDDQLETAKEIISTTGADYEHILPSDDLNEIYLSQVMSIPETLFVDSNGKVLDSVIGARSEDEWKQLIDSAYEQAAKHD